jgi:predicted nucleic acid-binding protein
MDFWIAAIAKHHGLTLVTRNVRDFQDLDVPIINPWTEEATS